MIECVVCTIRYSLADIESGLYSLHTGVCSRCYAKMQKQPHHVSCFGKPSVANSKGKQLGYNPKAIECKQLCPDRSICRSIVWVITADSV